MKKGTVLYVTLGFFLVGVVYVLANLSMGRTNFFGRALTPGAIFPEACRVFASPVISKAGGMDRIRVTVFVLDDTGKGVPNKKVDLNCKDETLCQTAAVTFSPVQSNTDNTGQAIFDLSAQSSGSFELQAGVGSQLIPQTVTVVFQ